MGSVRLVLRTTLVVLLVLATLAVLWLAFWLLGFLKLIIVIVFLWLVATSFVLLHSIVGRGGTNHGASKHSFRKIGDPPKHIVDIFEAYPPDDDSRPPWA